MKNFDIERLIAVLDKHLESTYQIRDIAFEECPPFDGLTTCTYLPNEIEGAGEHTALCLLDALGIAEDDISASSSYAAQRLLEKLQERNRRAYEFRVLMWKYWKGQAKPSE